MGNLGAPEILVIAVFALLVFGPQKLPEIARSAGRALREFKKATSELTNELQLDLDENPKPKKAAASGTEPAGPAEPRPGPR